MHLNHILVFPFTIFHVDEKFFHRDELYIIKRYLKKNSFIVLLQSYNCGQFTSLFHQQNIQNSATKLLFAHGINNYLIQQKKLHFLLFFVFTADVFLISNRSSFRIFGLSIRCTIYARLFTKYERVSRATTERAFL